MQWKDIEGYEGRYQVSDTGLIKSCEHYHPVYLKGKWTLRHRKEQLLKQWKRSSYLLVDLWKDGKRDVRSVHILVYEAFNGPIQDGNIVHHKDHNKFNNAADNLMQISMLEHNRHHMVGRVSWNKGKKMPKEMYIKMWKTRREKNANRVC